nr:hypothetical protein CFP56_08751 [Quercus suber]
MADELEALWSKLSFTKEEGKDIALGSSSTKAAREIGKNCVVMKILTKRIIFLEVLRKNMKMLWKPNKGLQIFEIEDDMFLVEFGDGRDKKRIMEMSPWSFEKQLILVQEFEGELVPKEIVLKWTPFWVQIYNLPLKSMICKTGMEIGAKIGMVLDIDVLEKGVQWGKFLRERLPNFCYRCGKLDHGEKECAEKPSSGNREEEGCMQYGAWLRGEPGRRVGNDQGKLEGASRMSFKQNREETTARMQVQESVRQKVREGVREGHVNGQRTNQRPGTLATTETEGDMQWEKTKNKVEDSKPEEKARYTEASSELGLEIKETIPWAEDLSSPLAMSFNKDKGWVAETLGPTNGHWKRLARQTNKPSPGFTQGMIVPSDGKSGGLAMLWKEGVDVRFKSCSHSHIDVVVHGEGSGGLWRTTGFYGHPITSKRQSSWKLIKSLFAQCKMPWLVCGDFNEIMHPDKKIGWKERDADQMGEFKEFLSRCGLIDLGFVGPRFTWCNGRFGDQRTLLQLDRMVANEEWMKISLRQRYTMCRCRHRIIFCWFYY